MKKCKKSAWKAQNEDQKLSPHIPKQHRNRNVNMLYTNTNILAGVSCKYSTLGYWTQTCVAAGEANTTYKR